MKRDISYDENSLEQNEPFWSVSQWQLYNDCDGGQATADALFDEEFLKWKESQHQDIMGG
jgi:hypothetical protein